MRLKTWIISFALLNPVLLHAQKPDFSVPLDDQINVPHQELMETVQTMRPELFRSSLAKGDIEGTWETFALVRADADRSTSCQPYRQASIVFKPNLISKVIPATVNLPELFADSKVEMKDGRLSLTDPSTIGVSWECRFFRYEAKAEGKSYMVCTTPGGTGVSAEDRTGLFFVRTISA